MTEKVNSVVEKNGSDANDKDQSTRCKLSSERSANEQSSFSNSSQISLSNSNSNANVCISNGAKHAPVEQADKSNGAQNSSRNRNITPTTVGGNVKGNHHQSKLKAPSGQQEVMTGSDE